MRSDITLPNHHPCKGVSMNNKIGFRIAYTKIFCWIYVFLSLVLCVALPAYADTVPVVVGPWSYYEEGCLQRHGPFSTEQDAINAIYTDPFYAPTVASGIGSKVWGSWTTKG